MKYAILVVSLISTTLSAATPIQELRLGDQLPDLRGEFLNGHLAVLPAASKGRAALLLLGFTYGSSFAVEDWAKQFRERFAKNDHATFFEIPMIGGMARMGKWFIDSGMRRGTPKEDHEHVITVYGGSGEWKQRVGFMDPKAAYVILIDSGGRVAWRNNGPFDAAAFEDLTKITASLAPRE